MSTYTISPSYVYEEETEYRVDIIEFEDGSEKRMRYGSPKKTFTLRYDKITETKKDSILTFFDGISGTLQSFTWNNPLNNEDYTVRLAGNEISINEPEYKQYDIQISFIEDL